MSPEELLGRIERLERQNRTMKVALAAGLALIGLLAVLQLRSVVDYDEVRAGRFTILDNKKNDRGFLGVEGTTATLRLRKSSAHNQVSIEAQTGQTVLALAPPEADTPRVVLSADPTRSLVAAGRFQETAKPEPAGETTSP